MHRLFADANRRDAPLVLAIVAFITLTPLTSGFLVALGSSLVLGLTVFAWHSRSVAATSLGGFVLSCVLLGFGGIGPEPLLLLPLAFAIYAVVVRRVAWLRPAGAWLRRGELRASTLALCIGVAAVSALALVAWYSWTKPDLTDLLQAFVPNQPLWILIPGAALFSLLNAALEEAVYRGVVQETLEVTLGSAAMAIFLQAVAFGTLHIHGFPRGITGVGLAFIYGLALGALRRKSGGLLAPWLAHVLTDMAISAIVILLARGGMFG